ncbi:MAG: YggS family pyridoxal phosphate-dependent enzyme [Planctomycetota bacterium]
MPVPGLLAIRGAIQQSCRSHGRDPAELRLIAVTKTQDPVVLSDLAAAGIHDCGENRPDHLALMRAAAPPATRFHFIGVLQSRQFKHIVPLVDCIHSLFKTDHIAKLDRLCGDRTERLPVFCQVNTSGEPQKGGCAPDELPILLDAVRASRHLALQGLMCMAPDLRGGRHPEDRVRRCFESAADLNRRHDLPRLSMGMSEDFQLAIAAGATDLRIGSALFRSPE